MLNKYISTAHSRDHSNDLSIVERIVIKQNKYANK